MRTVGELIAELERFPKDARCWAYEGEATGIVVDVPDGFVYCGSHGEAEHDTEGAPSPSVPTLAELDALAARSEVEHDVVGGDCDGSFNAYVDACKRAGVDRYAHAGDWYAHRRDPEAIRKAVREHPGPRHAAAVSDEDARALRVGRALLAAGETGKWAIDVAIEQACNGVGFDDGEIPALRAIAAAWRGEEVQP